MQEFMRYGVFAVVVSGVLATPLLCHAQEPAPDPPVSARRWYGWQTFTTDGIAGGLFVGAVAADRNTALYGSSAVVFGLGAPLVHLAHGHWEYALCSVGLRVALPLLGAVIAAPADVKSSDDGAASGAASAKWTTVGVALSGVAASLFDGFVLAYDQALVTRAQPESDRGLSLSPYPSLRLLPRGALFGVSGTL